VLGAQQFFQRITAGMAEAADNGVALHAGNQFFHFLSSQIKRQVALKQHQGERGNAITHHAGAKYDQRNGEVTAIQRQVVGFAIADGGQGDHRHEQAVGKVQCSISM
jgi:hypothetical protein